MASLRTGKPYIWVTWLSSLLGGNQCVWSAWFKAHYRYQKFEEHGLDLAQWNRDHTALMKARQAEMEEAGYTVTMESENAFTLEGSTAILAGKPDLIASMAETQSTYVIDGKTGRRRDSDWWQVLIYLFALPKDRPELLQPHVEGEIQYKHGDQRIPVKTTDLTPEREQAIVSLIKTIGSDTPPAKAPSRDECERCNIGVGDCPVRVQARRQAAQVGDF